MTAQIGIWSVGDDFPVRVERSDIGLEADLEDWVAGQPSLLLEGLQVVGRQLHVDAGYIDLLCLDATGRWVIVELKRGQLYRDAIVQAIDYASCIQTIDGAFLRDSIRKGLDGLANRESVLESVDYQLQSDDEGREVAIIVAGAGVDPGMERVVTYLGKFEIPIRVVSFDVFGTSDGSKLLVREVLDDENSQTGIVPVKKARTVDEIGRVAEGEGVGEAFNQIIAGAEEAGLFCRPYKHSVMITPPTHKNRYLMVLNPREGLGLRMSHGSDAFAEFFSGVVAHDVEEALGPSDEAYVLTKENWQEKAQVLVEFFRQLPEAGRDGSRRAFFTALLEHEETRKTTFAGRSPSSGSFLDTSTGVTGVGIGYGVTQHGTTVYLWIDRGKDWADWNDAVYRCLISQKEQIEADFGEVMTWDAKETNRSRKLASSLDLGGWVDHEAWPEVIEATVETMIRFDAAIRPRLGDAVKTVDAKQS
jgi:hypothetical protein